MKYLFLTTLLSWLFLGCSSTQRQVIASNDDFIVLQTSDGESYKSLADEFLGGEQFAEIIERYNPQTQITTGTYVAVPKRTINPSGVFVEGYQRVPILCYHQFTDGNRSKNKMVVTGDEFERQMSYLAENNYNVLSLSELGSFLNGDKELPVNSVVITIDDGYKSYLDVAYPILEKYGFPSTMFVYPDFIGAGPALKWGDVKRLSQMPLVDIQSHSKSHDSLSPFPGGESNKDYLTRLKLEVEGAEKILSRRVEHSINHFAYPYGNSSVEIVKLLEENDYELAVTVHKGSNPSFSTPFLLHRTMIYGGGSLKTFQKSLDTFSQVRLK